MIAVTSETTAYFLAFGKLYEAWLQDGMWHIGETFKCTHCEYSYAVDLMKIGFKLALLGWRQEDIELVQHLAESYHLERGEYSDWVNQDPLECLLTALTYYERHLQGLNHYRRMDQMRKYYRQFLTTPA